MFNPVLLNNISCSLATANAEVSEENEMITQIFNFNFYNVDDCIALDPDREYKVKISVWLDEDKKEELGVYHLKPDPYGKSDVAEVQIPPEYQANLFEITAVDFPEDFVLTTISEEAGKSVNYLSSEPYCITISKTGRFSKSCQFVGTMSVSQPDKCIYKIGEELDLKGAIVRGCGAMTQLGHQVGSWDEFGSYLTDGKYSIDESAFDNTKPGCYFIEVKTSMNVNRFGFYVYVVENEDDIKDIVYNQGRLKISEDKKYIRCGDKLDIGDPNILIASQYYRNGKAIDDAVYYEQLWSDYTIDTSAVDVNTPGEYEVKINYTPNGEKTYDGCKVINAIQPAVISVTVVGEDDEESDVSEEVTDKDDENETDSEPSFPKGETIYQGYIGISAPDKTVYRIGEELDFKGALLNGGGSMICDGEEIGNWDISYSDISKNLDGYIIDTSEFDNTKPGRYHINVSMKGDMWKVNSTGFDVTVTDEIMVTMYGDANCDKEVSLADTVTIMQSIANPDKYPMTEQGRVNADVANCGDGITGLDALAIQKYKLELITELPEKN